MSKTTFTVSRNFAAEILNVSVRTLDRYTKIDKISSLRRGRYLFFNEQELLEFKAKQFAQEQLEKAHQKRHSFQNKSANRDSSYRKNFGQRSEKKHTRVSKDFVEVEEAQQAEQEGGYDDVDAGFADIRDSLLRRSPEESIFKSLYKKAEMEIKDLRNQLQLANYKVGKLDARIESMVPAISFRRQKQELLELSEENRKKQSDLTDLENALCMERWVKRIYAAFLFFMMALLPLLLILRLFA